MKNGKLNERKGCAYNYCIGQHRGQLIFIILAEGINGKKYLM